MCEEKETDFGRNLVSLLDEEGNETSYEMIDAIKIGEQEYVALLPVVEQEEDMLDEDYQVEIFKIEQDGDEEILVTIDNEEEFNNVWNAFEERLSDEFEIVN